MQTDDIDIIEMKLAEVNAEMRAKAGTAGTPEFRKLTLTSRTLTNFLRGRQTAETLAWVQSELKKIEEGTHADSVP